MDLIVGFFSGFLGGLGVGGGGILLLYLTAFENVEQLTAQGINLVFFIPTAVAALFLHIKNGFVKWKTAAVAAVFGVAGVIFGSFLAGYLDKILLKGAYAVFLLIIGVRELFKKGE